MLDVRALRRLTDAVEAAQQAAEAVAPEWREVIALGLDIAVGCIRRRNLRGLSHVESALIEALAAAQGYALSRGDILERLGTTSGKAIPVALVNIRRARPDLRAHVEAVYGVGYRWNGPPLADLV